MQTIRFSEKLVKGRVAYDRIADLQNMIINATEDEVRAGIDVRGERLGRTFMLLIGCLGHLGLEHNKKVNIVVVTKIREQLRGLDILRYFADPSTKLQRFRRLRTKEDVFQLVPEIINEAPIEMSEELEEEIVSIVGEMFNNAIDHSGAQFVFGGKYFKGANPQHNRFCFSCYDTGRGIPTNVRDFHGRDQDRGILSDDEAIEWAIKRGHTTKPGISRGLGIDLLIQLAKANNGALRICSGHALFTYSQNRGKQYHALRNRFLGTLFEMDILQDKQNRYTMR